MSETRPGARRAEKEECRRLPPRHLAWRPAAPRSPARRAAGHL